MSDTMDECRAHVAEQRHERGDCGPNCPYCEDEDEEYPDPWICTGCGNELLLAEVGVCAACRVELPEQGD